jgi:signal transduction histidine kinase
MAAAARSFTPSPAPALHRLAASVRRTAGDFGYHLLALPATVLAFTTVVAGVVIALCLAITIVGAPAALAVFAVFRANAALERRRAALALGVPVTAVYRPRAGGLLARLRAALGDPQSWRDLGWLAFAGTLGFAAAVLAVSLWAAVLGLVFMPAWYWALPDPAQLGLFDVDGLGTAFAATGLGLLLVPVVAAIVRPLTEGQMQLARVLLGRSREAALTARVDELTATRAGAVDAAAAELRRIERDLHDGAQARLVALAMDLGMAEERFDRDPESARALIGEAREEARRALAELRDLARGIRPSLLAERGLGPALQALAGRSGIPVDVDVTLTEPVAPAVELAAWFVASEGLANAAKHAEATLATVRARTTGGRLQIVVADDGRGGADPSGPGLTGLRRRVEALDGTLAVMSPPGGPTIVHAELPCAS